ncbi:MAG: DNA-processing protein DprA [Candidatus Dojkabacteria bacterium]|nr:DNA-processing protein DprA [Candidatus Dojkabacteria bacterium]
MDAFELHDHFITKTGVFCGFIIGCDTVLNVEGTVSKKDQNFPVKMRDISGLPSTLYYCGAYNSTIFSRCLGVVGSRRITPYGKKVIETIIPEIVDAGISIVSGFMNGVDACAHAVTLECGGKTIAVLPCGIRRIHPSNQFSLYAQIIDSGSLILSEYPGKTPTARWTYPRRNRIVAALSDALLVIEAAKNSGTLMTAGYARSFGKPLLVVPNSIFEDNGQGILALLRSGAIAVGSAHEVLETFEHEGLLNDRRSGKNGGSLTREALPHSLEQQHVLSLLRESSLSLSEIASHLSWPISSVSTVVMQLQEQGEIVEQEGVFYAH